MQLIVAGKVEEIDATPIINTSEVYNTRILFEFREEDIRQTKCCILSMKGKINAIISDYF